MHPRIPLGAWCPVIFTVLTVILLVEGGSAQPQTLVVTGQSLPSGSGAFGAPVGGAVNDLGQVVVVDMQLAETGGTQNDAGIFLVQQGTILELAREGQSLPGGGTLAGPFHGPALNNDATAVGALHVDGRVNSDEGIFRLGSGGLDAIVSEGDPAPGGGTFAASSGRTLEAAFTHPTINPFGQTAFIARVAGLSVPGDSGVFRADPADVVFPAEIFPIARMGDVEPAGTSLFAGFEDVSIGPGTPFVGGMVSFAADLHPPGEPLVRQRGIFRGSVTRRTDPSLMEMARQGKDAAGRGTFGSLMGNPVMNDLGHVAFIASIAETGPPGAQETGIFRSSGFSIDDIVVEGDAAPDGNGTFAPFVDPVAINTLGQVAFRGRLENTSTPGNDDEGLFVGNGNTLAQIARAGEPAPGGGVFSSFDLPSINLTGKMAFTASVHEGNSVERGVFFYDPAGGLFDIARAGDGHLGSALLSAGFAVAPSTGPGGLFNSGLSTNNTVAFSFSLADGRQGVALWTQPIVLPGLEGDFNNNRRVEQGDLNLVLLNWGRPASPLPAGWSGPPPTGSVDQNELNQVLLNWGFIRAGLAIPEPSALRLAAAGLLGMLVIGGMRLPRHADTEEWRRAEGARQS